MVEHLAVYWGVKEVAMSVVLKAAAKDGCLVVMLVEHLVVGLDETLVVS